MKDNFKIFILLSVLSFVLSCGGDDPTVDPEPEEIELNKSEITLEVTDKDTLLITTDIGEREVTWESSDSNIVSVDENGNLLALKSGSAIITASVDGVLASCDVTVDLTIFLGGSANEFEAAYWKNGKINYLTTTGNDEGYYSYVNSIKSLNGHIYAGGIKLERQSIIWRDSEEIILKEGYKEVEEIAINEENIYAVIDNGEIFKWNETDGLVSLGDDSERASSIYIENNDIFIAGHTKVGDQPRPAVWKNGNELVLDYNQYSYLTDIYVSGNNFYTCGSEYLEAGVSQARFFKNTTKTNLTEGPTYAFTNAIHVEDDIIYIGGTFNYRPVIWINSEITYYAEQGIRGSVNDIQFFNGDLYAAGSLNINSSSVGVVWKNGQEIFRTDIFEGAHIESIDIK